MIKVSNSSLISIFTRLLIILVVAKSLSLIAWWYFPSDGVELSVKENYQPPYKKYNFKNMVKKAEIVKEQTTKAVSTSSGISIKNMILKGLYGTETKGFVIVAKQSSAKKTSIVGIGEEFEGYTLKSIMIDSAIFEKNGTDYVLNLAKPKQKNAITKVQKKSQTQTHITEDGEIAVNRNDITFYAKNPKQIWKDISIKEVKDGKKIKGFKVTKIKSKSRFAALGLKKGDLIIKANNVKLESYKNALEIYKNIDKLKTIQIVVIRDNQEKELVYEIN